MSEPSDAAETNSRTPSVMARRLCAVLILLSTIVSCARLMHARPLQSANDRSRWMTVWSLAEQGTYRIDDIRRRKGWDSIDIVRHDGHFYSTKPPLFPTMVAGLYWTIRSTLGWSLDDDLEATTRLLLLLINVIPMTVALVLLDRMFARFARTDFAYVLAMAAATFGTLLLQFLMALNNHTVAACCLVFALVPAVSIMADGKREWWRFALAGFWAMFTCCNELPAASFGVVIFVLLALQDREKTLKAFVPAALVPLIAFFITTYLATGGWKPFYLYYGTEKYEFIHQGIPSYWLRPRGIDRNLDSPLMYLLHCTLGHHGVFSLTPVFLLSLAGFAWGFRQVNSALKTLLLTGGGLSLLMFVFYLSKTEHYNYGGLSVALRWMLWLVPFWLIALIPPADEIAERPWASWVCGLLLAGSVFSAWYPLNGPWKPPWLYTVMQNAGWIDYSDPKPKFSRPVRSWIGQIPTGPRRDDYWIELTGSTVDVAARTLRLEDLGPVETEGRAARRIRVIWKTADVETRRLTLDLDPEAFNAGKPMEEALIAVVNGNATGITSSQAIRFLKGGPFDRPYRHGGERYLRSGMREDAFRAEIGVAQATVRPAGDPERRFRYRRDVWFCRDVPFGLLSYDDRVTDVRTGAVVASERLSIRRAGTVTLTTDAHEGEPLMPWQRGGL